MKVWYVFSRFPCPSETFAGTDVRTLRELGFEVRAANLRPSHPAASALLQQWDLTGLEIDEVTPAKLMAGVGWMLRRVDLLGFLLWIVVRDNWRRPEHLVKSLLVLPRIFNLHRALTVAPPDVLHHFWGHFACLLGLLVRRTHPGVVVTVFLGAYDLRCRYRTSTTLAREADQVFTHARANLALLAASGIEAGRVTLAYRGLDLGRLRFRAGGKIPWRIASAGRLTAEKGFADVLEVFAFVQRQWPQATLCVIGDGSERASLEQRVRHLGLAGVEFTGHLEHRRVFERLCEAEVFLFLSEKEHLPNVVKEAIAARCACVVSRTTGIEELVAPDQDGFVVGAGDRPAAVNCVNRLFQEPALREGFVSRALAHLEARFDVTHSMRRYGEVWQERLAARRNAAGAGRRPGRPGAGGE
jgi:glycosyltransferase involved in cell wall biosynthesis